MRPLPARSVRQALTGKGFHVASDKAKKRDHEMYFLHVGGLKSGFFMKISRSAAEVRVDEISNTARQLGVVPSEFFRVLSCELDSTGTLQLYQGRRQVR